MRLPEKKIHVATATLVEDDGASSRQDIPAFYLKKLAYPFGVCRAWMKNPSLPIDVDAPIEDVIDVTAKILGKEVRYGILRLLDSKISFPSQEPRADILVQSCAGVRRWTVFAMLLSAHFPSSDNRRLQASGDTP